MSQQGRRSEDEDRLDENPYAAPVADLGRTPHRHEPGDDDADIRRRLQRARTLRLGGLIGLFGAVFVLLSFGFGTLSQLGGPNSLEARGIEPWIQRRWIARMSSVLCLALVAAWACWGLFLLRVWARWLLTCVAALPIPVLACGWVLVVGGFEPGVPGGIDPDGLLGLSFASALGCLLLYPVLWSPGARAAISPEIVETLWETPREPSGCSGIIYALGVSFAVLFWFSVLQITWLSTLAAMGLIRSI